VRAFSKASPERRLKPPFSFRSAVAGYTGPVTPDGPVSPGEIRMRVRNLLLSVLLAATVGTALADDDHERARAAMRAGEIMPLHALLERVAQRQPGQVVEVELEREDGMWVYEIKLLRPDGILLKLELDARDATVLGSRRKREDG